MLVIAIENAPPKLRGYLSSWMLQVAAGVYVANLPARTREVIWTTVQAWSSRETAAVLLWSSSKNEQGLDILMLGSPRRRVREIEGLLVSTWIPQEIARNESK